MKPRPTEYVPPKRKDAIVRQLEEECLVLDRETSKAHCLNYTAARIWRLCDGQTSVADMVSVLSEDSAAAVDESLVWLALKQLRKARLLSGEPVFPDESPVVSRRLAVQKIAVAAALAVPVVTSILVPTPAQAASCLANGKPCTSNAQCCSGKCGNGLHCNA
jgi:Coenzyme PQQ synthesis protein D (PqqD)